MKKTFIVITLLTIIGCASTPTAEDVQFEQEVAEFGQPGIDELYTGPNTDYPISPLPSPNR